MQSLVLKLLQHYTQRPAWACHRAQESAGTMWSSQEPWARDTQLEGKEEDISSLLEPLPRDKLAVKPNIFVPRVMS